MSTPLDIAQDGHLFPRQELASAVAAADWRDRPVPRLAWALMAAGLVLIWLGLPVQHGIARHDVEFAEGLRGTGLGYGWLHPLHALCAAVIPTERSWFLVAAVAGGATLLAGRALLRGFGMGGRLALVTAALAAVSPLGAAAARLPGGYAVDLCAMAAALGAVAGARRHPGAARELGAGAVLLVATWLTRGAVLAVPGFLIALGLPRGRGAARVLGPVAFVAGSVLLAAAAPGPVRGAAPVGAFALLAPGALLIPLAFGLRGAHGEAGPPRWLLVHLAASLALLWIPGWSGPAAAGLLVAALPLATSALMRVALPGRAAGRAGALALAQGALLALPAGGALGWRLESSSLTGPGADPASVKDADLSPVDRYVLRQRGSGR